MTNIISKIKEENLLGRSGSMFPVWKKWEAVKNFPAEKRYVICNASEGELETFKDYFILKNHFKEVVDGIKIALQEVGAEKGYIYLNTEYYEELSASLKEAAGERIEVVKKRGGYIGGEETAVIEAIEGNRPEPRIKPPFPSEKGLWGFPTLVNKVENFYWVSKVDKGEYQKKRFYSVGGSAPKRGVFLLPEDATIRSVLEESGNTPPFDYFLQVGGGACGTVTLPSEIDEKIAGVGSVVIYNREETDPYLLMKKWVEFLLEGNCDKCTPCREGLYRIMEMIERKRFQEVEDIFYVMEETSLCPLGKEAVKPFKSLLNKIILCNEDCN